MKSIIVYVVVMLNSIVNVCSHHVPIAFQRAFSGACNQEKNYKCIELWKCPYTTGVLHQNYFFNIQIQQMQQCGMRGRIPMVCCPEIIPTTTESPTTSSVLTTPASVKLLEITHKINDRSNYEKDLTTHENYNLIPNNICGEISNKARIISGTETDVEEFPWMALLVYHSKDGVDFRCGGTVINNRYILTAAHCIDNTTIAGVRLGEYDINTAEDCTNEYCAPSSQDFFIQDVIIHTDYTRHTLENDIALIRLSKPANFSYSNVKPICLPFGNMMNEDLNGKFVTVTGWGLTEKGLRSSVLQKVSVPVVPLENCNKMYAKHSSITSKQICAGGYLGKDSCEGDSGGPLMYVGVVFSSTRYIQYGIVSYGPKHCGDNTLPAVYTRVGAFLEWILDNIKRSED